jgi:hypothetical protein
MAVRASGVRGCVVTTFSAALKRRDSGIGYGEAGVAVGDGNGETGVGGGDGDCAGLAVGPGEGDRADADDGCAVGAWVGLGVGAEGCPAGQYGATGQSVFLSVPSSGG